MAHRPFEPTIAGLQVPPPYECTGLKVFGFPLLADIQPLKDLCDEFLNVADASAEITFEPIQANPFLAPNSCIVMMQAIDYESLNSTKTPWHYFGGAPQREIYFAVPVLQRQAGVPVDVGVFLPYVYVDNQASALSGREVLGIPKLLAALSLKRNFPATPIVAHLEGRRTRGGPIEPSELLRVTGPFGPLPPPGIGTRIGMFFGPVDLLFAGTPAFAMLSAAYTSGSFFGFSSRMLINPGSPTTDSYRSIIRCTYATTSVTSTGFLPPVKVTFSPLLGVDIASTLGIRSFAGAVLPIHPFFVDCDLHLDGATTLWESCSSVVRNVQQAEAPNVPSAGTDC